MSLRQACQTRRSQLCQLFRRFAGTNDGWEEAAMGQTGAGSESVGLQVENWRVASGKVPDPRWISAR